MMMSRGIPKIISPKIIITQSHIDVLHIRNKKNNNPETIC